VETAGIVATGETPLLLALGDPNAAHLDAVGQQLGADLSLKLLYAQCPLSAAPRTSASFILAFAFSISGSFSCFRWPFSFLDLQGVGMVASRPFSLGDGRREKAATLQGSRAFPGS
jgi:hypothetical protein